nr:MAG TPA: hypothetical protein [Caudoviricetes sp.]
MIAKVNYHPIAITPPKSFLIPLVTLHNTFYV